MSAAAASVEIEGRRLIALAARSAPAKIVANKIGCSPRHVDNLRAGLNAPRWPAFLALAL